MILRKCRFRGSIVPWRWGVPLFGSSKSHQPTSELFFPWRPKADYPMASTSSRRQRMEAQSPNNTCIICGGEKLYTYFDGPAAEMDEGAMGSSRRSVAAG